MLAALAVEDRFGRALDGLGAPSQQRPAAGAGGARVSSTLRSRALPEQVGRGIAFENDRRHLGLVGLDGQLVDFIEQAVALVIRQPDDLEGAVPFHGTGGVVVDPFAGPGEQARGGIVVVHDQIGVGLVALEGDADGHLAEGGAGQRVGPAEGLRAEQDVNAEGAALSDDPVQQQRGRLGDGSSSVKNSWNSSMISRVRGIGSVPPAALVAGEVLRIELAEAGRRGASIPHPAGAAR